MSTPGAGGTADDPLIKLVSESGAHPLTLGATKVSAFDTPSKETKVAKTFLNAQLKTDPCQPFCIWRPYQREIDLSSSSPKPADLVITVGNADGKLVTSRITGGSANASTLSLASQVVLRTEVLLRSQHRVLAIASAPSHPLMAAVCDGRLFIMSTDPCRFCDIEPTIIAHPVKKCRPVLAFDDHCLYYLIEGKDKMFCLSIRRLLDSPITLMPDGKLSQLLDVEPLVVPVTLQHGGTPIPINQFDVTALSASSCIIAIAHTKGFIVLDLNTGGDIIHRADHDGSTHSMITVMTGGIVAIANHPNQYSIDDAKKVKNIFEDSIVFLQPPRNVSLPNSPDALLRNHMISCVRYSGTGTGPGCTIKGMTAVGSFMFVLLGLKNGTPNANRAAASADSNTPPNASHSTFVDICVPSSGLSLSYYRFHPSTTNLAKRLQHLLANMPCFQNFNLKWIASAGSSIACINELAPANITLFDLNPLFFQIIMDAHWFRHANRQALPSLSIRNGTCDWDLFDIQESRLKDHWWKTLCFDIRRPQKVEVHRIHLSLSTHLLRDSTYSTVSCFRTITRDTWELILREDESDEGRAQRLRTSIPASSLSIVSDELSSTTVSLELNPWIDLVSECASFTTKPVTENMSDFEKLDLAFGRSTPSLKPGCMKQASDEDRMKKAREIMTAGMNKKDKMSLPMADLASGPCARFFEMHICLSKISLSPTIGLLLLPLTMSCCLYAPNGSRITSNYEVDRRPNDPGPFDGPCIFANISGSDTTNQKPPQFVIAVFRFYCHFRGDKRSPNKNFLEKENIAEIKAEQLDIYNELTALGHMLQPLAWSFVVIPLEYENFDLFSWPEWVTPDEKALFMKQSTSKGMQPSEKHWPYDHEHGFCSPVYRLNNKPFSDEDLTNLVQNFSPPRRDRLTSSTTLSFLVRKGRLSLPRFADILPPSAIIYATPEDER